MVEVIKVRDVQEVNVKGDPENIKYFALLKVSLVSEVVCNYLGHQTGNVHVHKIGMSVINFF
jgi:hypothetical protein